MLVQDVKNGKLLAAYSQGNVLFIHGSLGKNAQQELHKRIDIANKSKDTHSEIISKELNLELWRCIFTNNFKESVLIGGHSDGLKAANDGIVHNREFSKNDEPLDEFFKKSIYVVGHMTTKTKTIEWNPGSKENIVFCDVGRAKGTATHSFTTISTTNDSKLETNIQIFNEGQEPKNILVKNNNSLLEISKVLPEYYLLEACSHQINKTNNINRSFSEPIISLNNNKREIKKLM